MLRVAVPAPSAAPQALSICSIGAADAWIHAKTTGEGINSGIDAMLGLVDLIRTVSPSQRTATARIWGPFDDQKHPGREDLITITRRDEGCVPGGPVCYVFTFQARVKGQGDFQTIIDGQFQGASAERGDGAFQVHFDTIWSVGVNDADSPRGEMPIVYSRSGDPRSIDLQLQQPGFGLTNFDYSWRGYANGNGSFDYRFVNGLNVLTVQSRFDGTGAGRGDMSVTLPGTPPPTLSFSQCWDAYACLSWVYDPNDFTQLCPPGPSLPPWCTPTPPSGACAVQ